MDRTTDKLSLSVFAKVNCPCGKKHEVYLKRLII